MAQGFLLSQVPFAQCQSEATQPIPVHWNCGVGITSIGLVAALGRIFSPFLPKPSLDTKPWQPQRPQAEPRHRLHPFSGPACWALPCLFSGRAPSSWRFQRFIVLFCYTHTAYIRGDKTVLDWKYLVLLKSIVGTLLSFMNITKSWVSVHCVCWESAYRWKFWGCESIPAILASIPPISRYQRGEYPQRRGESRYQGGHSWSH